MGRMPRQGRDGGTRPLKSGDDHADQVYVGADHQLRPSPVCLSVQQGVDTPQGRKADLVRQRGPHRLDHARDVALAARDAGGSEECPQQFECVVSAHHKRVVTVTE